MNETRRVLRLRLSVLGAEAEAEAGAGGRDRGAWRVIKFMRSTKFNFVLPPFLLEQLGRSVGFHFLILGLSLSHALPLALPSSYFCF